MENPNPDYSAALRSHRFRRIVTLCVVYSFLPVCALLYFTVDNHIYLFLGVLPAMGLWGFLAYSSIWWTGQFRCPRCKRRFGSLGSRGSFVKWTHGLFEDVCPNCKLPKAPQ